MKPLPLPADTWRKPLPIDPAAPRLGRDLHAEDLSERYQRMRERQAPTSPVQS
jgi:hypothetical protein